MADFNFPYHTVRTEYPESGFRVQLGNSYQYSAPPPAPDQRVFKLKFKILKWFTTPTGQIDRAAQPEINIALLEDFYLQHKMFATFTYNHPVHGSVSVRFNKPLQIPEGIEGGDGAVPGVEVEFIEVPGLADSGFSGLTLVEYEDFPA